MNYRPWGEANWLLEKLAIKEFSVFGCLSAEKRSYKSLLNLQNTASNFTLVSIFDISPDNVQEEKNRIQESKNIFQDKFKGVFTCRDENLGASLDIVDDIVDEIDFSSGNIVIDISSLPKRWYFYIAKRLLEDQRVRNLVAVYTSGVNYSSVLSSNCEPLRALPGFASETSAVEYDFAFIGIGFQALSVFPLFEERKLNQIRMLFPFPPGPPSFQKNWEFVERVHRDVAIGGPLENQREKISSERLAAYDVSQAFDAMASMTNQAKRSSLLAPYGPKPMSLAMCLFSLAADQANRAEVPAYYTQPTRYSLDYTGDAKYEGVKLDSWAYALKLNNRNLYQLL